MTNKELIKQLSKFPEECTVFFRSLDNEFDIGVIELMSNNEVVINSDEVIYEHDDY